MTYHYTSFAYRQCRYFAPDTYKNLDPDQVFRPTHQRKILAAQCEYRMRNQILLEAAHASKAMDDVRLYCGDWHPVCLRPNAGTAGHWHTWLAQRNDYD
ncbi:MAG TPA: hypothetical protein VFN27_13415 [Xanthobacteraceae bacterium]|nr:hypothetical protein [Xanthobacteraceae bacterium]